MSNQCRECRRLIVWHGADDTRQQILDPLKSAHVELGDGVRMEPTIVQPQTYKWSKRQCWRGPGWSDDGCDECTQMVVACMHNAGRRKIDICPMLRPALLMPWDMYSLAIVLHAVD